MHDSPILRRIILCTAILALSAPAMAGPYNNGLGTGGTVDDPWEIETPQDLIDLGNNTGDYGDSFIMTAHINMAGIPFATAVIAPDTSRLSRFNLWVQSFKFDPCIFRGESPVDAFLPSVAFVLPCGHF